MRRALAALLLCFACKPRPAPTASAPSAAASASAPAPVAAEADATPRVPVFDGGGVRLSDESTLAIAGTARFVAMGAIKDPDAPKLEAAMRAAYTRMKREEEAGELVRLAIGGDELVVLGPRNAGQTTAVVFLHGWGGRWSLPCWQIARAVAPLRAIVACPDDGMDARWWESKGEATLTKTVATLKDAGYTRLVLAGLSNGASGAGRLAARRSDLAGLVSISGADGAHPASAIPTLVIHGKRDAMASFDAARAYATKSKATFLPLESGHFAMLLEADALERALREHVEKLQ